MYKDRWDYKVDRMKKKITLRELAKYIHCSITLLSKYENGDRNMVREKVEDYKYYIDSTNNN